MPALPDQLPLRSLPTALEAEALMGASIGSIFRELNLTLNSSQSKLLLFKSDFNGKVSQINFSAADFSPPGYKYAESVMNESAIQGKLLLIFICNFHVLSHLLLISRGESCFPVKLEPEHFKAVGKRDWCDAAGSHSKVG